MTVNARVLHLQDRESIKEEFKKVGADSEGIEIMLPKGLLRLVKLEELDKNAANILKQEMLSRGGEVAVSRKVYELKGEKTDAIVIGTIKQFEALYPKLERQPFGLGKVACEIKKAIYAYESFPSPIKVGNKTLDFSKRTYVMGVLNVTPDSFSDGGKFFDPQAAVDHAKQMADDGADIVDIGGESTRPGAEPVGLDEELKRTIPVIEKLAGELTVPISIDTYKSEVAREAIEAGALIVNDISGLRMDEKMADLVAERGVPLVIMHMQGTPRNMQKNPTYKCVMGEITYFLRERAKVAIAAGIKRENIIVDPGIGFGKTVEHNLEILARLPELKSLGFSILLGPSRKSFIGYTLDLPVEERLEGTAATIAYGVAQGANIVRVHDVKEMIRVVRMIDAIKAISHKQ